MSAATSPGTGLAYGLRRVCAAWGMARSSFYAMTSGQHAEQPPAKRRGPKPAISDQALLVAIEADLEASPWEGEGYRKVWARLRVCRDIRVARKRVLRLMRENNLRPIAAAAVAAIPMTVRSAPNLMWGTDGVRVFTVDDGWGWIFTAASKRRVCRLASASAATASPPCSRSPSPGCMARPPGAARGLALRNHGSISVGPLHQPDQVLGHPQPSYAFSPRPTASPSGSMHAEGTDFIHGRMTTATSRSCLADREFVEPTMPSIREESCC